MSNEPLSITGDFNIHVHVLDDANAITFLDFLQSMALSQYVKYNYTSSGSHPGLK